MSREMESIYKWFRFFLGFIVLYASGSAFACNLPTDPFSNAELFPHRVRERYCNPEAGYTSLLLIKAAIDESTPVFRIIAVRRDESGNVQSVRLYQFDKNGNDLIDIAREPQAVIDFKGSSLRFEGRVKGRKVIISFVEHTFGFDMHGIFGLRINQQLNAEGRITVGGKPTSVLLVSTLNKDHWNWVLDDGLQARF